MSLTQEHVINKFVNIHGDTYDYSKIIFTGVKKKVIIICHKHGEFHQSPQTHYKSGCPKCHKESASKKQLLTTEEFIKRARLIHGDKYKYDNTIYKNAKTNVVITCEIHGDVPKNASHFLSGQGCKYCSRESLNNYGLTVEGFTKHCDKRNGIGNLYLFQFVDENNTVYKIGITSRDIEERQSEIPYPSKILLNLNGKPEHIYFYEKFLHKLLDENCYVPIKKFCGHTECFHSENNMVTIDLDLLKKETINLIYKLNNF